MVIAVDSGGMHFANALGVPVVALFGKTDHRKAGPIYDAPTLIVHSKDNLPIENLSPEKVAHAIHDFYQELLIKMSPEKIES
jgi:ADP-heptose:LPS heptosyltransferase